MQYQKFLYKNFKQCLIICSPDVQHVCMSKESFPTLTLTCGKLYFTYYTRKATTLAMRLGLAFSWTPCINYISRPYVQSTDMKRLTQKANITYSHKITSWIGKVLTFKKSFCNFIIHFCVVLHTHSHVCFTTGLIITYTYQNT